MKSILVIIIFTTILLTSITQIAAANSLPKFTFKDVHTMRAPSLYFIVYGYVVSNYGSQVTLVSVKWLDKNGNQPHCIWTNCDHLYLTDPMDIPAGGFAYFTVGYYNPANVDQVVSYSLTVSSE